MRQVTVRKIWMVAFLMAGFVAGCGREQAPSPVAPVVTNPTVISTNPLNGAITVPINQKIIATFNGAMNSATVIASGDVYGGGCRRSGGARNGDLCGGSQHGDICAHSEFAAQHSIHGHHEHDSAKRRRRHPGKLTMCGVLQRDYRRHNTTDSDHHPPRFRGDRRAHE